MEQANLTDITEPIRLFQYQDTEFRVPGKEVTGSEALSPWTKNRLD
jgi:hypothetical protein